MLEILEKIMVKFEGFDKYYKGISTTTDFSALKTKNFESEEIKETKIVAILESSISFVINDTHHIGVICTPKQLEALIVGHLISEGYVKSISSIEKVIYAENNEFKVYVEDKINIKKSDMEIRTAGMIGLKSNLNRVNTQVQSGLKITPQIFFYAQEELTKNSVIWPVSGGAHMSSLHRSNGELCYFAEDVGRHNTIDKIIGLALLNNENLSNLFSCTSGRVSEASIIKYARVGIPILISVSAPTAEGIKMAKNTNITVVGFSRKPSFTIYSIPERIII